MLLSQLSVVSNKGDVLSCECRVVSLQGTRRRMGDGQSRQPSTTTLSSAICQHDKHVDQAHYCSNAGVVDSCAFALGFMYQVKYTNIPAVHSAFESSLTTACLLGTPDLWRCQARLLRQLPELHTLPAASAGQLSALLSAWPLNQHHPECCSTSESSYPRWPQIGQAHSVAHLPLLPCGSARLAVRPSLPAARKHHCNHHYVIAKAVHLSCCSHNICFNMRCLRTS